MLVSGHGKRNLNQRSKLAIVNDVQDTQVHVQPWRAISIRKAARHFGTGTAAESGAGNEETVSNDEEAAQLLGNLPVTLAAAILLSLLGVLTDVTVLSEEARKMLLGAGGAVSQASVVLIVVLRACQSAGLPSSRNR